MQKRTEVKNIDILERERERERERAVFSKIGFIKHVKEEIKINRDRLCAKVKKLLKSSLSFLRVWRW